MPPLKALKCCTMVTTGKKGAPCSRQNNLATSTRHKRQGRGSVFLRATATSAVHHSFCFGEKHALIHMTGKNHPEITDPLRRMAPIGWPHERLGRLVADPPARAAAAAAALSASAWRWMRVHSSPRLRLDGAHVVPPAAQSSCPTSTAWGTAEGTRGRCAAPRSRAMQGATSSCESSRTAQPTRFSRSSCITKRAGEG